MSGIDKLTAGMKEKLDLTDKKASKTVRESRKQSFTEMRYRTRENSSERQQTGNTSEATQERTSSSSNRDIESDAGMVFTDRRQKLRQLRWQERRRSGGVLSESGDGPRHWRQGQGNEVKTGPNGRKSNPSKLGPRKGGEPGESSKKPDEETSKQQEAAEERFSGRRDFNHDPNSQFKPYVSDAEMAEFERLMEEARQLRQYKDK